MFLLLLFLLIATTLINPNALKLMLPKSANQLKDKAITTVSIQQAGSGYNYYVELEKVSGIDGVEQALRVRLDGKEDPTVSLHCDKTVAVDEVVKVMINPNAVKLTLPKSSNQIKDKAATSVSITADLTYYLETEPIAFDKLEAALQARLQGQEDPVISLHTDETVPFGEVIKVMNIAKDRNYKLILATQP